MQRQVTYGFPIPLHHTCFTTENDHPNSARPAFTSWNTNQNVAQLKHRNQRSSGSEWSPSDEDDAGLQQQQGPGREWSSPSSRQHFTERRLVPPLPGFAPSLTSRSSRQFTNGRQGRMKQQREGRTVKSPEKFLKMSKLHF